MQRTSGSTVSTIKDNLVPLPAITDNPPQTVQNELASLASALDSQIPAKADDNLLIATWNIRAFGSLTRKWLAGQSDSPKRDLRGLRAIIEILSRFDVIAIQEVTGDLRALRDTVHFLGENWGFLMTDVNIGDAGNDERFVILFDRERLRPSGLAAEIVIPPEQLAVAEPEDLHSQFVRPPYYAVSFQRGEAAFILVTLHVIFGEISQCENSQHHSSLPKPCATRQLSGNPPRRPSLSEYACSKIPDNS